MKKQPVRIKCKPQVVDNDGELLINYEYAKSIFPFVECSKPQGKRLAIVGSSPSIADCLDEIKSYDEIWAINGTQRYLKDKGIDSVYCTCHVGKQPKEWTETVDKALVISTICKEQVESLKDKDVKLFSLDSRFGGLCVMGGTTTATALPHLGLLLGFLDIGLFGCDSSYTEQTHVNRNDKSQLNKDNLLIIEANGIDYLTNIQMMMQCEDLITLFNGLNGVLLHNKSKGLLEAMLIDKDWTIKAFSEGLYKTMADLGMVTTKTHYKDITL